MQAIPTSSSNGVVSVAPPLAVVPDMSPGWKN